MVNLKWKSSRDTQRLNEEARQLVALKLESDAFFSKVAQHINTKFADKEKWLFTINRDLQKIIITPQCKITNPIPFKGQLLKLKTYFGIVEGEAVKFFNGDTLIYAKISLHKPNSLNGKDIYCFPIHCITEIQYSIVDWVFRYGLQNIFLVKKLMILN